jgi:dihydropteroate synthase
MQIAEQILSTNDGFINALINDVSKRQQNLFLSISSDDLDKLKKVEQLLIQMDCVLQKQANSLKFSIGKVALKTLKNEFQRSFPDDDINYQIDKLIRKYAIYWRAGKHEFNLSNQPLIYAILNITPDSFYDGGRYANKKDIEERIEALIDDGVDVIEVGGQTTRPGFQEISATEELARIQPVIQMIKVKSNSVAIAVDTYKFDVMKEVVNDVDIINDVNAFTDDVRKLTLLKESSVGLLTMHSARDKNYSNLTIEMKQFFESNLQELMDNGINRERIALDQGIGYAKVADGYQDYAMMNNIDQFNYLERPMMVAISRKGFGAKLFGLEKEDRLPVTLVAESYMYLHGGKILRVHDIEETKQLVKMLDVIQNGYWFGK